MNDYDLENQSRGRDRSSCRRFTTALTGTVISISSLLNTRCNALSVPTTIWLWICLSEGMPSDQRRSMRPWDLNGCRAVIRSTSLTRSCLKTGLRGICVLPVNEVAQTWNVPPEAAKWLLEFRERIGWQPGSFLHFDAGIAIMRAVDPGQRRLLWRSSKTVGSIPKPFSPR
jgi:hypothetical protein